MKKRIILLVIIFLAVSIVGTYSYSETKQLTKKEKVEDFNYMYNTIKNGYPYLGVSKRCHNLDWLVKKDIYMKRIENTKNDEEFMEELSLILGELGNRHTELINNRNRYKLFKKAYSKNNWYEFLDDEKVVNRYKYIQNKIKIPKNILLKKELILKDVVNGEIGYIYLPSMASKNGSIKKELGIISDYIDTLNNHKALIIDIRGNKGGSDSYWKGIVSKLIDNDIEINGYRIYRNDCEVVKDYTEKRERKLSSIKNLPKNVVENAPKEIVRSFSDFEHVHYIIKSDKNTSFKGNIYLLTDESVYSSSETFAMFCKDYKFATIIGQTTGGDGGGLDPILIKLRNSGLVFRMASGMYLNKYGICNEEYKTIPDFKIKYYKRTKNLKNDRCIEKVFELEKIKITL